MPLIDIYRGRPPQCGKCSSCGKAIEWVRTKTGKLMPVDHPLRVEGQARRPDGSTATQINASQSHFATCPDAERFRRPQKQGRLFDGGRG